MFIYTVSLIYYFLMWLNRQKYTIYNISDISSFLQDAVFQPMTQMLCVFNLKIKESNL